MTYVASAAIPQTSIAERGGPPVTVRFLRWTAWKHTAYQKGQCAGFSEEDAQKLVRGGAARIVHRQ